MVIQKKCFVVHVHVVVGNDISVYLLQYQLHHSIIIDTNSLFTFMMISKLGCNDFICNVVCSLIS